MYIYNNLETLYFATQNYFCVYLCISCPFEALFLKKEKKMHIIEVVFLTFEGFLWEQQIKKVETMSLLA